MKKVLSIIPILILLVVVSFPTATNAKDYVNCTTHDPLFEPGTTVFIELPGFDFGGISHLKNILTSADVGAEWLGYCANKEVICVKIPAGGQIVLERGLKPNTGHFKIVASTEYSLTDTCFITE